MEQDSGLEQSSITDHLHSISLQMFVVAAAPQALLDLVTQSFYWFSERDQLTKTTGSSFLTGCWDVQGLPGSSSLKVG